LFTLFPGNKKSLSDNELVRKFHSSGNPDFLGEFYSRYMHLVYGVCLKYLKNREESKDAVMQIFEKLLTDLPDYEIHNFKAWLYVLSKNYCLMQIRFWQNREKKIKLWQNDPENFMESDVVLHPLDEDTEDNNSALRDCIEKLKKEQKECIGLFYFQNKSYREICILSGIEEKKVKSLLQNAKRNLKICMENNHVEKN
jgi:RNA polymerase sigma-70 factor (ECF subfamily)